MGQSEFKVSQGCTARYCLKKKRKTEEKEEEVPLFLPGWLENLFLGFAYLCLSSRVLGDYSLKEISEVKKEKL